MIKVHSETHLALVNLIMVETLDGVFTLAKLCLFSRRRVAKYASLPTMKNEMFNVCKLP